jgi:hypothetical protein
MCQHLGAQALSILRLEPLDQHAEASLGLSRASFRRSRSVLSIGALLKR